MRTWLVIAILGFGLFTLLNIQTLHAGNPSQPPQNPPTTQTSKEDTRYAKVTQAIMSLHQRISILEKGSGGKAQEAVAQLQKDLADVKKDLATVKSQEAENRNAITQLHQRLTFFDHKSKALDFSSGQPAQ